MTSFLSSLCYLSFKQAEINHSLYVNCIKTSIKQKCCHGKYSEAKSEVFQSRCDSCWQQWGRKKSVKYVEKLFKSYKLITASWEYNKPLVLFFSNGSIVTIELNGSNNTIKKIQIDESLHGKFLPSRIVDVILLQKCIFISYSEPKLSVIRIDRESLPLHSKILGKRAVKVLGLETIINHIDLIGPASKNIERKLSLNCYGDYLLVWWHFSGEVWPWTPVAYATDCINMLVYNVKNEVSIVCTVKVNGDLISAHFSKTIFNQVLTIEEVRSDAEVSINVSIYEIIQDRCHHVFTSKLPLQGKVVSFDWNSCDKLIIVDSNNMLLIYDLKKKSSLLTNLSFIPKQVVWHPQDCIALVNGLSGQIQCFDSALNCLKFKFLYNSTVTHNTIDLSKHFGGNCSVQKLLWQKSSTNDTCLFLLESELSTLVFLKLSLGYLTRSSLSITELISEYLKSNAIDDAILLLRSMNWFQANELHFQCLSKIANCLLRKPLNMQNQAGLEMTLGTFYNSIDIVPKRFLKYYQGKIMHIARRFFHHLLRFHQFRKAFLLAVDLDAGDLFLDLSHMAKEKGENILAFVAYHKAHKIEHLQDSVSQSSSASSFNGTATDDDVQSLFRENDKEINFSSENAKRHDDFAEIKPMEENKWFTSSDNQILNQRRSLKSYSKESPWCRNVSKQENSQYLPSQSNEKYFSQFSHNFLLNQVFPPNSDRLNSDSFHAQNSGGYLRVKKIDIKINPIQGENRAVLAEKLKKCVGNSSAKKECNKESLEDEVEDSRIKFVHFGII